jgi:hypothetical protein
MTLSLSRCIALALIALVASTAVPAPAMAAVSTKPGASASASSAGEGHDLEKAAERAQDTGRKIATSLIAVGFAIASIVLAFRRDFKEAAGVFAIGFLAVLLAGKYGVSALEDTVKVLFG